MQIAELGVNSNVISVEESTGPRAGFIYPDGKPLSSWKPMGSIKGHGEVIDGSHVRMTGTMGAQISCGT